MTQNERNFEDSTVDTVLNVIRQRIITGEYPPNSKIMPKQIAEDCGTSFIPVREALRVLESEGFVSFVHNRGAWVTPLSLSDLEDLYTIRLELECEAIRRAGPMADDELAELDAVLTEADRAASVGAQTRVIELNRVFHFGLYAKANSPRRLKLIEQLWMHSARYQRLSLVHRDDAADGEHRLILNAMADGRRDTAADALRDHLETTVTLVRERCRELIVVDGELGVEMSSN
jgi:DNA-binding GntR family transcriptional regulator